jgi:AcrR family transcriptional regulator
MAVMSDSGIGLRELKKQMTRESLADAALRLALDKGLDQVTIEEIAQVAFVSPRTFSNYFSCKEEAVAVAQSPDLTAVLHILAARPPGEPPLSALSEILAEYVGSLPPDQLALNRRKIELGRAHPSLHPYLDGQYGAFERQLRLSIAQRFGVDPATDMYSALVSSAAVSAIRSAVRLWVSGDGDGAALARLIREAFDHLAAGLPEPEEGPSDGKPTTPARRSAGSPTTPG